MFELTPPAFPPVKKKKAKPEHQPRQKRQCIRGSNNEYFLKTRTGTFEKKLKSLLENARYRAKEKNIEFSITMADFIAITHCPILGLELDFAKRGKGAAPNSPSIDRIDPSKGYVPGNVWIISNKANRMKSDATLEELETLVKKLREKMETM